MAIQFTASVYGMVQGQPPFTTGSFTRQIDFATIQAKTFPSAGVQLHPVSPGVRVGNSGGNYIYSVIEVPPAGLNVAGDMWTSGQTVAALATLANA